MELFQAAADLRAGNKPFALATIVSASGSTPRSSAKMIIQPGGRIAGTIGGGLAESFIIREAEQCLETGMSKMVEYTLDNGNTGSSIAMTCGGSMKVFIEVVTPRPELLIAGGGHVALQIAHLASRLDFSITVVENREEFISRERFPMARQLFCRPEIEEALALAEIGRNTYIVICTGNVDEKVLRAVINSPAAYIGLLGSRRKTAIIAENMKADGFDGNKLAAVHGPIGLDIRAETPEEIALSILAEIRMIQTGGTGRPMSRKLDNLVVFRGGGDIASGSIARVFNAGFPVAVLETARPTVIRSTVAFAQAVYDGRVTLEGITAQRADSPGEMGQIMARGSIPVAVDPQGELIPVLKPLAVVDAILAKRNLGTSRDMAPVVIGLGPGFEAGLDVHAVIETNRGHNLGRVILQGKPEPDTGIPGTVGGESVKRVVRAPAAGKVEARKKIGDSVEAGEVLALVGGREVLSGLTGVVRGMIHDGMEVPEGFKIADVDPRGNREHCRTISDKARAVGGGTLEALLALSVPKRR